MATAIKAIFRGTVTYVAADGTAPAAISLGGTIVTTKSIVSMTIRSGDLDGRVQRHYWQYDLTTTTISFSRTESANAKSITIEWEVIEFDTGVTVQRGNENFGTSAATHDITITAITEAQSFVTIVAAKPGGGDVWGDATNAPQHHYIDLTSTTNIKITAKSIPGTAADSWTDSWQVIEFDNDVSVQRGLSASSGGDSRHSRTIAITSVDTLRSFAVHCGMIQPSGATDRQNQTLGFNSGTELKITSINEGTLLENTTSWAVLELPSGETVESGSVAVLATNTTPATQPNWTTALSNGSLFYGYFFGNVRKTAAGTAKYDDFMFTVSLDSPEDSLTVQRNSTDIDFALEWFAIDWPVISGVTTRRYSLSLTGVG